ncbi:keratin, type I cytoskeletal 13-like isoform X1 [Poecilia reticulata]|uniref:keratin, type I cytoskeletal 13-like isoform X1 n=2 Tax=Poecilia reticulata TaxID=8081 RepID=UPI0004A3C902|nr:PREDICTED: keratin, type I cytoskeletal 13-like isoform X1 [Poecilia reticulata]
MSRPFPLCHITRASRWCFALQIISSCFCWFRSKLSKMSLSSRSFGQMSTGRKTMSVYGGAGGSGTRISVGQIDYLTGSGANNLDPHVDANEKATLQNLNDRLASYLEKVHKLEKENERLEKQIAEWYSSNTVISHDYSAYMATIEDLQNKIRDATTLSTEIDLEINNSKLAADNFKMKSETELSMRQAVEGDITGLKRVMDDLTLEKLHLETLCESLKEELIMLKRDHEEEISLLGEQIGDQVNVEVDVPSPADLSQTMTELREHYEALIAKNSKDVEMWYQNKMTLEGKVVEQPTSLEGFRLEMKDLKAIVQRLQIDLQSSFRVKLSLEESLQETQQGYAAQLAGLQVVVTDLEAQISEVNAAIEEKRQMYDTLLDLTTRLEAEIVEYRRLLDGEDDSGSK